MKTLALVIALFTGWTAHAQRANSVVSFGSTEAERCYSAAEMSGGSVGSLVDCTAALKDQTLSKKDRIATLINRGILFNHRRNYAAAIADFETALALDPQASAAYVNRGNAYFATRQFDLAIDDYSASLQMNSAKPHIAHYNRGLVNEIKRKDELAFADFVRATELRPDWEPALTRVQQYRAKGFESRD
ncbi:MAG: tetratricopeptide repeat protein [Deltaproteobacteria bacterium]|jgi:tetratricopeptide (TPR) repeat protein|nr:tetratricopeptide repeat protein [Deltaproteobacteria bacterium]